MTTCNSYCETSVLLQGANRLRRWHMEPAALSLTDLLHPDLGDWSDSESGEIKDTDELLLLASQLYESMSNQLLLRGA